MLAHIGPSELAALAGSFSSLLGILAYMARTALKLARTIDGHIHALKQNTLATYQLSGRMKHVEDSLVEIQAERAAAQRGRIR